MMRPTSTDLYAVLGVAGNAGPEAIKRAYRKLTRELHPDVAGNTDGEERFKAISYAYEILSDPVKRAEYDRARAMMWRTQSPTPAQSNASTRSTDVVYPQWDEHRLQREWEEFISTPFNWSERVIAAYFRWEWLFGIAALPVLYLFISGKINGDTIFIFMFSKASAPGVDNVAPFMGLIIGAATGWAVTALSALHAVVKHRYSFRNNARFRRELREHADNMFLMLNLVGGIVGLMIGHYLV